MKSLISCLILATLCPIMSSDTQLLEVQVTHLDSPNYSVVARHSRTQGDVKLKVQLTPDGAVRTVTGMSGDPLLIHDATVNIQTWRFNRGAERTLEVVYEFRLVAPEIDCQTPSRVAFDL